MKLINSIHDNTWILPKNSLKLIHFVGTWFPGSQRICRPGYYLGWCCPFWSCLAIFVWFCPILPYLAQIGHVCMILPIWPTLAQIGTVWPIWPRLEPFGPVWPHLAPFGPIWPCFASFDPVWPLFVSELIDLYFKNINKCEKENLYLNVWRFMHNFWRYSKLF